MFRAVNECLSKERKLKITSTGSEALNPAINVSVVYF